MQCYWSAPRSSQGSIKAALQPLQSNDFRQRETNRNDRQPRAARSGAMMNIMPGANPLLGVAPLRRSLRRRQYLFPASESGEAGITAGAGSRGDAGAYLGPEWAQAQGYRRGSAAASGGPQKWTAILVNWFVTIFRFLMAKQTCVWKPCCTYRTNPNS